MPIRSVSVHHEQHDPLAALPHPIIKWYKSGHPFVLCCDNVGLLQCTLSENYQFAAEGIVASRYSNPNRLDFDNNPKLMDEVGAVAWELALAAVDHTFASDDVKKEIRVALDQHPWSPNNRQHFQL